MSNVLALKYSTAEPETLLGILPMDEVVDVIRDRLRPDVAAEIEVEFQHMVESAEDEAEDNYQSMCNFRTSWKGLDAAIKKALNLPWDEAKDVLNEAIKDCNPYED